MGELFAYGSLLLDGYPIRLTGEDCERGTFSHRHAVLFDGESGEPWSPLDHIETAQSRMCIHNSPVTESGCIGFEYGYSLGDPNMLVIWEAQFGDFANVGQVYFDQFIASAEQKWRRHSGLICLLPHGYEGMGPEHSSARLERFLQLCANDNIEVAIPTTPAQMFHLLRRQMRRSFRKPLMVLTPKSLLRHRRAVSTVAELTSGQFQRVLDDQDVANASDVRRVLFCSGKVAWDLMTARDATPPPEATAIVRLEQLYPFPESQLREILDRYHNATTWMWVQEEPRNAGAWTWIADTFQETLGRQLAVVSRPASASPAVGSARLHRIEQAAVLDAAFGRPRNASTAPVEQHT
jgi:2-oxoglutarate dehydrogenase E1 component